MRLTAKEIAEILGISRRAVNKRAQKEGWLFVEESSERGKPTKFYIVESLPEDVRDEIYNGTDNGTHNGTIMELNGTTKNGVESGISENGKSGNVTLSVTCSKNETREHGEGTGIDEKSSAIENGLRNFSGGFAELAEPKNGVIAEPEKGEIWLSVDETSKLLGISDRAVRKRCQDGSLKARAVYSRGGFGGKVYEVALSSLPDSAQVKWVKENPERAKELTRLEREKLCVQADWEITLLKSPTQQVGLLNLANEDVRKKIERKVKIIQEALRVPRGYSKVEWIKRVADRHGVSLKTVYRDIKIYKTVGVKGLVKQRKKPLVSWSKEALDYLSGVYLKGIEKGGTISKSRAYEIVLEEAKSKGWKVGSLRSAMMYLDNLSHLLVKYAKGGRMALSNFFYIARSYKDLMPFEIVVCDQHRFDFWVKDLETGEIFRPECFACIDMRTRLIYGMAITKHYDKYLVGQALKMGLLRFGLFQKIYTDNGKPELSEYVETITKEFASLSVESHDIAELYKTEDGYVIEDDKGNVVDVVDDVKVWHKKAEVRNAKAKPIERFFRTFEGVLRDLGVPGLVNDKRARSEEHRRGELRIKELVEKDRLYSFEEFLQAVFEGIEKYNNRKHRILRRSPFDELKKAVEEEGFVATRLVESEIDFILLARAIRSVRNGRVIIDHELYEGEEITKEKPNAGLWNIPDGTRVEVRYDPYDEEKVFAVLENGDVKPLKKVIKGSMKDDELTKRLLARKREMIKACTAMYRQLTQPVKGVIKYSRTVSLKARQAFDERVLKREEEKLSEEEIMRRADEMIEKSKEALPFVIRKKPIYRSKRERYQYCLQQKILGGELEIEDLEFMKAYESNMDDSERDYWDAWREVLEREVKHE